MSDDTQAQEHRLSVQISENAKGEPSITVKAYVHDAFMLDAARDKAVEVCAATRAAVRQ